MKVLAFLLIACFAVAEDASLARAVDGAKLLHSTMRDPDSFKIGKVWLMSGLKTGEAVCYQYYARNGFGGMNASRAVFSVQSKKGYKMLTENASDDYAQAMFGAFFNEECGEKALKHNAVLKDVTEEVKAALASASDSK